MMVTTVATQVAMMIRTTTKDTTIAGLTGLAMEDVDRESDPAGVAACGAPAAEWAGPVEEWATGAGPEGAAPAGVSSSSVEDAAGAATVEDEEVTEAATWAARGNLKGSSRRTPRDVTP